MPLSRINSASIANNAVVAADIADGTLTAAKIISIANTQITGNIVSSQITSVANTQITGTITGSQISSNTLSNTVFQTGSVENYMSAAGLGFGMRNRLINGAQLIDQRNAGASVTSASPTSPFCTDRWQFGWVTGGTYTVQQVTDAPTGYKNSVKTTVTSPSSSSDSGWYYQKIEANNAFDLNWGTSSGQAVTLSFQAKASLTGTYNALVEFYGGTTNYFYFATYTISSANTWTSIVLNIPAPPTAAGAFTAAMNNPYMLVAPAITTSSGLTATATANTWGTASTKVAGTVDIISTNGATFQFTGVQLEKGSTATSFDYRPYGTELALCQRYYYVVASQAAAGNQSVEYGVANFYSATELDAFITFPVSMRTNPTLVQTSGTAYNSVDKSGTSCNFSAWTGIARAGTDSGMLYISSLSGFTAGYSSFVFTNNNSAYIAVSAEL